MTDDALVTCTDGGAVLVLTMNRPSARNALNRELIRSLYAALKAADADESVRAVVLTGADLPQDVLATLGQPPLLLETSRPGIFCVGDVRSGSIKRTATAIGEGSMAVRLVFDRLQATGLAVAAPRTVNSRS